MAKLLSYEGLQKFYELIDEKYVGTNELNTNKGLAWAVSNQDDVTNNGADPIYQAEIKIDETLDFTIDGKLTAAGLTPATDSKLGTIKTYVNTYDATDNPTGDNVGIKMVASDPTNAPTVLDRATVVGVEAAINKGKANGYCPLDNETLVPSEYLPSFVDDVVEGYYNETDSKFYKTFTAGDPDVYADEITGEAGKIYVDLNTSASYRWGGTVWVEITSGSYDIITDAEITALFA